MEKVRGWYDPAAPLTDGRRPGVRPPLAAGGRVDSIPATRSWRRSARTCCSPASGARWASRAAERPRDPPRPRVRRREVTPRCPRKRVRRRGPTTRRPALKSCRSSTPRPCRRGPRIRPRDPPGSARTPLPAPPRSGTRLRRCRRSSGSGGRPYRRRRRRRCRRRVLCGRVCADGKQRSSNVDHTRSVHLQGTYGRTSCRCQTDDVAEIIAPLEMIPPLLPSRVVQSCQLAIGGVRRFDLVVLVTVAAETSIRQVLQYRQSTAAEGDDMFDGKRLSRESLRTLTVLTPTICPLGDDLSVTPTHSGSRHR